MRNVQRRKNPKKDRDELSELEAALAALVPRAERLNRDRLMFLAGQASVGRFPICRKPRGISPI